MSKGIDLSNIEPSPLKVITEVHDVTISNLSQIMTLTIDPKMNLHTKKVACLKNS